MKKLSIVLLLLALAGCGEGAAHVGGDRLLAEPDEQEVLVTQAGLTETWTRADGWLVSPPLAAPAGATQVGAILETNIVTNMPAMEARLLRDGEPVTEWLPLGETWSEVVHHVAVVAFDEEGTAAELRIPAGAIDGLRHLQWSAVIPGGTSPMVTWSTTTGRAGCKARWRPLAGPTTRGAARQRPGRLRARCCDRSTTR